MPEKFRPSNATSGDSFIAAWCGTCARDKAIREGLPIEECDDDERCDIVGKTFQFQVTDPEYPDEWTFDLAGRPRCTAYIPEGMPVPTPRCTHTLELF